MKTYKEEKNLNKRRKSLLTALFEKDDNIIAIIRNPHNELPIAQYIENEILEIQVNEMRFEHIFNSGYTHIGMRGAVTRKVEIEGEIIEQYAV